MAQKRLAIGQLTRGISPIEYVWRRALRAPGSCAMCSSATKLSSRRWGKFSQQCICSGARFAGAHLTSITLGKVAQFLPARWFFNMKIAIWSLTALAGGPLAKIALWRDESSSRFSKACCSATLNIARVPGRHIELAANCGHGAHACHGVS